MKKTILILFSILLVQLCIAQEEETVCENNEYTIKLIEYDSIYSVFEVERYHDISYYFGEVSVSNDTVFFKEVDDTFFLISPKIFLDYDKRLAHNRVEIKTNLSFWRSEWEWPYDKTHTLNDTIHQKVRGYMNPSDNNTRVFLENTSDSISLVVGSDGFFKSEKFIIDLTRRSEFYKNFKVQDVDFSRFNRVILKADIMGSQQLPGLNFSFIAPRKIKLNGKEYILINI